MKMGILTLTEHVVLTLPYYCRQYEIDNAIVEGGSEERYSELKKDIVKKKYDENVNREICRK